MTYEQALAQLRHAYKHAINGTIRNQASYGRHLLGPAIAALESLRQPQARPVAGLPDQPQDGQQHDDHVNDRADGRRDGEGGNQGARRPQDDRDNQQRDEKGDEAHGRN